TKCRRRGAQSVWAALEKRTERTKMARNVLTWSVNACSTFPENSSKDAGENQRRTKCANHRRASRKTELPREIQAAQPAECCDYPAKQQHRAQTRCQKRCTNCRNNEIREYEQHTTDLHEACHHEAKQ